MIRIPSDSEIEALWARDNEHLDCPDCTFMWPEKCQDHEGDEEEES